MKTYTRPMAGWWQRNPFYLWYMLREASCVFITAYALLLLLGLYRLAQGPEAFETWSRGLSHPLSIAFHVVALISVLYHSWTWFKIMPKTLPFIRLGGWRVPDRLIVVSGVVATVLVSIALLWVVKP
jgi:fumarate reductase subunit C